MTWPDLHETRIQGKRLRYELELLGAAFPEKSLDLVYRRISEVQSILGDVNDGFVGVEWMEILQRRLPQLFRHLWPRWSPLIEQLLHEYRHAMHTARDRFEVWRQKAERDQFDGVLRNILGGPGSRHGSLQVVEQAS
jgi:CHAD domain-containing protein